MSRSKRIRSRAIFLSVLAAFLCLSSARVQAKEDLLSPDEISPEVVNYKTETVQLGEYIRERTADANEFYPLTYNLKYEHENAKFVEYKVVLNQHVKAGDVLAEFRIEGSEAEFAAMELELTRTQEETDRRIAEYEEQIADLEEELSRGWYGTEWEIRDLRLKRLKLEMERYRLGREHTAEQQRKQLEKAKEARQETELIAPTDGVITNLTFKRAEDTVIPGEVLITMYSEEVMLLRLDNSDKNFRYHMPVTVTAGSNSNRTELTGIVAAAEDLIDETGTGYAYIALDPYDKEAVRFLQPRVTGRTVYLDHVLVASQNAAQQENGKYYVSKLTDSMVQKRAVTLGARSSTQVWIVQGVSEGETLILD